jgi:hypothetical protein
VKVIGAGFGRTGTLSLRIALEQLGFTRCYHMTEVMSRRHDHAQLWLQRAQGQAVDWRQLFEGYEATVDFPACTYYRELMDAFPDAKVLLSVRSAESWYDSARATIHASSSVPLPVPLRWIPFANAMTTAVRLAIWGPGGLFDGRFLERNYALAVYERWNESVKAEVPAERLLVFDVREGWGPLCSFLNVPVPDKPFPRVNQRWHMQLGVRILRAVPSLLSVLLIGLLYVLVSSMR